MQAGIARRLITHPLLAALLRAALGAVFIVASLDKIGSPAAFAQNIANYRLLPYQAIDALAIVLPWLEMVVGVLLLVGWWTRAAVLIVNALLLVFIVAISQAMARGLDISCGCFDTDPAAHKMSRWTLYWDIIWLGWGIWVLAFDRGAWSLEGRLRRNRTESPNRT